MFEVRRLEGQRWQAHIFVDLSFSSGCNRLWFTSSHLKIRVVQMNTAKVYKSRMYVIAPIHRWGSHFKVMCFVRLRCKSEIMPVYAWGFGFQVPNHSRVAFDIMAFLTTPMIYYKQWPPKNQPRIATSGMGALWRCFLPFHLWPTSPPS